MLTVLADIQLDLDQKYAGKARIYSKTLRVSNHQEAKYTHSPVARTLAILHCLLGTQEVGADVYIVIPRYKGAEQIESTTVVG